MSALDFSMRYDCTEPEPARTAALSEEGFQLYLAKGKIWARKLTHDDIASKFPAKKFIASWGSPMLVEEGDYLAMPFPAGREVYRIENVAFTNTYVTESRADHVPSQSEMLMHWGAELRQTAQVYYKTAKVHAQVAQFDGEIETVVDGVVEKRSSYVAGDYIMCGSRGGRYAMAAQDFFERYEKPEPASDPALGEEGFQLFRPTGRLWARALVAEDVSIHFPAGKLIGKWGGEVTVSASDYIVMPYPSGGEIYRIQECLFKQSYAPEDTRAVRRDKARARWGDLKTVLGKPPPAAAALRNRSSIRRRSSIEKGALAAALSEATLAADANEN